METVAFEDYKKALAVVKKYRDQIEKHYISVVNGVDENDKYSDINIDSYVFDYISVRLINCLYSIEFSSGMKITRDTKFRDIPNLSKNELYKQRGMGKKSIQELQQVLGYAGIELKP